MNVGSHTGGRWTLNRWVTQRDSHRAIPGLLLPWMFSWPWPVATSLVKNLEADRFFISMTARCVLKVGRLWTGQCRLGKFYFRLLGFVTLFPNSSSCHEPWMPGLNACTTTFPSKIRLRFWGFPWVWLLVSRPRMNKSELIKLFRLLGGLLSCHAVRLSGTRWRSLFLPRPLPGESSSMAGALPKRNVSPMLRLGDVQCRVLIIPEAMTLVISRQFWPWAIVLTFCFSLLKNLWLRFISGCSVLIRSLPTQLSSWP